MYSRIIWSYVLANPHKMWKRGLNPKGYQNSRRPQPILAHARKPKDLVNVLTFNRLEHIYIYKGCWLFGTYLEII